MKRRILSLGFIAMSMTLVNCSDNDDTNYVDPNASLFTDVIGNVASNVVVETYKTLNQKAGDLRTAINTLVTTPNDANLAAARQAWVNTRKPWEQSEGFLYGPVADDALGNGGLDPAMDTWPVDVEAMNNILNSGQQITANVIAANPEARGFHLIEFLLWGENGTKTAAQLTARELQYLKAAAEDLQNNTQTLINGWSASSGNYVGFFLTAGNSGNVKYPSQKAALEEFVHGIITIADEVANTKIQEPLNGPNGEGVSPQAEESRFSKNSLLDFADNIRSIQNVYLGDYGSLDGKGLTDIVASRNAQLDAAIKAKIAESISAIEAVPVSFTDAIYNNRPAVENAQQKVNELFSMLQTQLLPLINN